MEGGRGREGGGREGREYIICSSPLSLTKGLHLRRQYIRGNTPVLCCNQSGRAESPSYIRKPSEVACCIDPSNFRCQGAKVLRLLRIAVLEWGTMIRC